LLNKTQGKIILKFDEVLPVPSLLYDGEFCTLSKQQLQQIGLSEMRFLRSVTGYRKTERERERDKRRRRSIDIRQELYIFKVGEKQKTRRELFRIYFKNGN
jgi:hypothetical protein